MRNRMLGTPSSKIKFASGSVLVLLVAATAITIWRYEDALSASSRALTASSQEFRLQEAATAFWQEREAINEFVVMPGPELSQEVPADQVRFMAATNGLGSDVTAERNLVTRMRAANG